MGMRVRGNNPGIKGDECDCGRRASILHCNACGSTRIYARSARLHTHMNGETKFVETQLRCQTCGHTFIQEERQFCDAPPISEALAKLKVQRLYQARQQGEYLRPSDEKIAELIDKIKEAKDRVAAEEAAETQSEAPPQVLVEGPPQVLHEAQRLDPSISPQTQQPSDTDEIIPEGLTKQEFFDARTAFISEWTAAKISGASVEVTCQEYIRRRFNGEVLL
jgi:hypothetical protein